MTEGAGHNNPPVVLELDRELAEFLLRNCDVNIQFGLASLQKLASHDLQQQMVAQLDNFKALRDKLKEQNIAYE